MTDWSENIVFLKAPFYKAYCMKALLLLSRENRKVSDVKNSW
jgi:hypothetical protein